MENKNVNIHFPGFSTLLGIAFIVLKLCGVITWSWVWVLAPIWIGLAITLLIILVAAIIGFICSR